MNVTRHGARALLTAALALSLGACGKDGAQGAPGLDGTQGQKGDPGTPGTTGTQGPAGPAGPSAASTSLTGTATFVYSGDSKTYGATGVTVTATPGNYATTTSSTGAYTLTLPYGTYDITFAGPDYQSATASAKYVPPTGATLSQVLTRTNPLLATIAASAAPAVPQGFGTTVTLPAPVVQGQTGTPTYLWTQTAGPTKPALTDADTAQASLTVPSVDDIAAKLPNLERLRAEPLRAGRPGLIGVSGDLQGKLTYTFKVTVTDSGHTTSATVNVVPAMISGDQLSVPKGIMTIGNDATAASYAWTLTDQGSADVTATKLHGATTRNPWFIPDAVGTWELKNTATGSTADLLIKVDTFAGADSCQTCHDGGAGGTQYADWHASKHANHFAGQTDPETGLALENPVTHALYTYVPNLNAPTEPASVFAQTLFQFGIDGAEGDHYGSSCIRCHTLGYDKSPSATNGGFDDLAASANPSWSFPAHPAPGSFAAMPAALKKLTGMQCESCHGPATLHTSDGTRVSAPSVSMSSETCAFCHDKPANHDRYYLWTQSSHSELQMALDEGTVEGRPTGTGPASCARCHAGQGFVAYLDQRNCSNADTLNPLANLSTNEGAAGPLVIRNSDGTCTTVASIAAGQTFFQSIGLTKAQVQPQTCQTCHDPHTAELRLTGDTGALASGFQFSGAGSGALCMVCHNTRNGARGDSVTVTSIGSPHAPSQADVLAGQNAYFMGGANGFVPGTLSKHAFIDDTCVGCHMKLKPATGAGAAATNTNHTFAADTSSCATCHSNLITGEAVEAQFAAQRAAVLPAMVKALNAQLGSSYAVKAYQSLSSSVTNAVTLTQLPTNLDVASIRGQPALVLTFAPPGVDDPFNAGAKTLIIYTAIGDVKVNGTAVISANGTFAKAIWNYLIVNDGSNGIHNPSFVIDVLTATQAALAADTTTPL
jgi:hypothetical protein